MRNYMGQNGTLAQDSQNSQDDWIRASGKLRASGRGGRDSRLGKLTLCQLSYSRPGEAESSAGFASSQRPGARGTRTLGGQGAKTWPSTTPAPILLTTEGEPMPESVLTERVSERDRPLRARETTRADVVMRQ